MILLEFPEDVIVGTVAWTGSWDTDRTAVLATGHVEVPDGASSLSLDVESVSGWERSSLGGWVIRSGERPVDLGFLERLPALVIESVVIDNADEATFPALAHLAPGLTTLELSWTGFTDSVLPTVARLVELTHLQTYGNDFTDAGVPQLGSLSDLTHLALDEQTLTVDAFAFTAELPALTYLGLQDVPMNDDDLRRLQARLPGVAVDRGTVL